MKTLVLLSIVVLSSAFDKYTDTMVKNIEVVYKASTVEELQNAVNAFERIGGAEKTKWEPYYYASFGIKKLLNNTKRLPLYAYLPVFPFMYS